MRDLGCNFAWIKVRSATADRRHDRVVVTATSSQGSSAEAPIRARPASATAQCAVRWWCYRCATQNGGAPTPFDSPFVVRLRARGYGVATGYAVVHRDHYPIQLYRVVGFRCVIVTSGAFATYG